MLRRYHEWVLAEFTGSGSLGSIDYHASAEENEELSVEEKCRGIGAVLKLCKHIAEYRNIL